MHPIFVKLDVFSSFLRKKQVENALWVLKKKKIERIAIFRLTNPNKDLQGNLKPRVFLIRTVPNRNQSGVGEHFKEYFRVGLGWGILFRVCSGFQG